MKLSGRVREILSLDHTQSQRLIPFHRVSLVTFHQFDLFRKSLSTWAYVTSSTIEQDRRSFPHFQVLHLLDPVIMDFTRPFGTTWTPVRLAIHLDMNVYFPINNGCFRYDRFF